VLSSEVGRRVSYYRICESWRDFCDVFFHGWQDSKLWFVYVCCKLIRHLSVTWDVGKTLSTISIYKDFLFLPLKLFCDEGLIWEFLVCTIEFPQQGHWYPFNWTSIQKKEDLRETGVVPNHNVAKSICFQTWISNVCLFLCLFRKLYVLHKLSYLERNNMIVMNKSLKVSLSWSVSRQIILLANKSWIK